ncbi:MAG: biotin/lipoyl-binding protein, partial [Deltaproteobacteria bacterium]|nr:biotin/lipoyl-binding protein [Deltaproteobacteria bacterium]
MKKIIWIIIAILLIGGGVIVLKKKKQAMALIPPMKVYHQVVSAVAPKTENITLTLPALAQVQSDLDVDLSSKLSARITSMVKSGDTVSKGQIVVTLDHDELLAKKEAIKLQILSMDADITAGQIGLDNMISTHKRTKELLDVRGASIEQYDAEKSKIASMRAGLQGLAGKKGIFEQNNKELTNLLSYAVIVSPIDGMVSSTSSNVGVIAMPGKPLLSIQADSGKYLLIRSADDIVP